MGFNKKEFGPNTLALVYRFLTLDQCQEWVRSMSLSARIQMLLQAGAEQDTIDEVTAVWHGHVGPVDDFDFSKTTEVEIPAYILDDIPTRPLKKS